MKLATLWHYLRSGDAAMLARLWPLQRAYYRFSFLAAAVEGGVLERLADGPCSIEQLAADLGIGVDCHDGLQAWLDFGVSAGVLRREGSRYGLRRGLPRLLARPANDPAAAFVEEAFTLHHRLLGQSLSRLRGRQRFTLADQRGDLIARSSRLLAPLVQEAIRDVIPTGGAVRLFEIGCGTATYIRYAADRNPELTAVGLELQPVVAELARRNIRDWNLFDRVTIDTGDVRSRRAVPEFDIVTLHNNIYYFRVDERVALLAHVRAFLRPGGCVLVTTACQGGSPPMEILNLWSAMTAGCGRLPSAGEMKQHLAAAGYVQVHGRNLVPGDRYYAFVARTPE